MENCKACGGTLSFSPTKQELVCNSCHEGVVLNKCLPTEKTSLHTKIKPPSYGKTVIHCDSCGADSSFEKEVISELCSFCGSTLLSEKKEGFYFPDNIVPFEVSKEETSNIFKGWLKGLWFAPNSLKEFAKTGGINGLNGCYVPFWCFDADTKTSYSGERGDYFYVTKTRTVDGKQETYQERQTRWTHQSGTFHEDYRDVIKLAQNILPESLIDDLNGWDLSKAKKFEEGYVLGFQSLMPNISCENAWSKVESYIVNDTNSIAKRKIGGDEQRVFNIDTSIKNEMFNQYSLPVWIGVYKFNGKTYRVCINGENGSIDGERPYSVTKITFFVFSVLLMLFIGSLILNPELAMEIREYLQF